MKKDNLVIPLLLVNILLTIRSIGASYRASEWAAQGLISKVGATADYLFISSIFIILAVISSIIPMFAKSKRTEKVSNYGILIFLILAVLVMIYTVFL